jgi:DNA-binding beta-propeller fold protein YncE
MTNARVRAAALASITALSLTTACAPAGDRPAEPDPAAVPPAEPTGSAGPGGSLLAGMPEYLSESNVYAAAGPNLLSDTVRGHRELVYVPHNNSDDVWVIDPKTYEVVDRFAGGQEPQHVVPSYDLTTLYVASSRVPEGGLVPIDPATGKPGDMIEIQDVYNLYFTPDGAHGIVVAEAYKRLDFYDAQTWRPVKSLEFRECAGINHMDYSADGRTMLVSCEFANRVIVLDGETHEQRRRFDLDVVPDGMPQDVRLTPDGEHFLVADMMAHGVYVFNADATERLKFIPTGKGAHSVYFNREGTIAYIANRDEGTVTLLDLATLTPADTWRIPGGGSPDMGGLNADGTVLWLSGRDHNEVYAFRTSDGELLARIPVGSRPHGLVVWPQPGRYSLGHTGNIR